jgi:hypothetical protein
MQMRHGRSLSHGANAETIHHIFGGLSAHARHPDVSGCEYTLRWPVSLRIAFDLDGVLADMDSALADQQRVLFGKTRRSRRSELRGAEVAVAGRVSPILAPSSSDLTSRQRRKLWRRIAQVENFWQTLREIEPGAVKRLAAVAAAGRWEVIFLTKRPETLEGLAQVQSQRWLVSHGFERPSVYVVQGSRGLIAAALSLDVVVDDRPENCCDVVADSSAKAFLVWRQPGRHFSAAVERFGVDVVGTVSECLDMLVEMDAPTGNAPL